MSCLGLFSLIFVWNTVNPFDLYSEVLFSFQESFLQFWCGLLLQFHLFSFLQRNSIILRLEAVLCRGWESASSVFRVPGQQAPRLLCQGLRFLSWQWAQWGPARERPKCQVDRSSQSVLTIFLLLTIHSLTHCILASSPPDLLYLNFSRLRGWVD